MRFEGSRELGPPRQHLPSEAGRQDGASGVPAQEARPLCPGLHRLRVSVFIPSPWLDPAATAQSVSEAWVLVPQTQLSSHVCLAVLPNSWDGGRSPLPRVSAEAATGSPQVPCAPACPWRCLSYEVPFPEPSCSDPREAEALARSVVSRGSGLVWVL